MARNRFLACSLFALAFVVYNANGREIGSYDTQPAKFTAVELALHGTLTLDAVVARTPPLGDRPGFAVDRRGHFRSAYPLLPALVGAAVATMLSAAGAVDLREPASAGLVAKLTASAVTALAVALAFLLARTRLGPRRSALLALALGLGTNYWAVASQTLWQTETALATLTGALLCAAGPGDRLTRWRVAGASLLLGLAGAARPQLAPAVTVLAVSTAWRGRPRLVLAALGPLIAVGAAVIALNLAWFGHPLGAMPRLESLHPAVHHVGASGGNPILGAAGLLLSPSRGLLIFSPIIVVVLAAWPSLHTESWRGDLRWCALAAVTQTAAYASYSVWWGGHTFGPRYLVDVLPLLIPLGAAALRWWAATTRRRAVAMAALIWSVAVAATGAWVYPNERWNTAPIDVDVAHRRLWDWQDSQIVRCWHSGPSPANLALLKSVRRH